MTFPRVSVGIALAGLLVVCPGRNAAGQSPEDLTAGCTDAGGLAAPCAAASVAARALQGDLALAAGFGSEVSGTATTLATRVQGGPRISFAARFGGVDVVMPDLGDPTGQGETSFLAPAAHAEIALGLFDGVRIFPTVGGFLSLDAFGKAAFLLLPESEGFSGGSTAYTAGLRVGIFREGFTIPGVSVSASRRFVGSVDFGGSGDPSSVTVDPSVTSIRATVGKDLFAVEWLAGFGWDDFGGDVTVRAADGLGSSATYDGSSEDTRKIYFASASMTFSIVLNVAVEGGWAEGYAPVPTYAGVYDPTAGSAFGSLALRLIL